MGNTYSSHKFIADRKARRLTVLLGSAAFCGLFPTSAFAQCAPTTTSPSISLCENENTVGQVVTGPASIVTTASGFSVDAAGADALSITSTNGTASYIDDNASSLTATGAGSALDINATNGSVFVQTAGALTGHSEGVLVNQAGPGTITLDLSGAINSSGLGIRVRDSVLGGGIRVTTGAVTANGAAINVRTVSSTANVTVIANGDLQAASGTGISTGVEAGGTGNIDLTANGAIDGLLGALAQNSGTGSVKITTVGPVNALNEGISALTNGGDVTVIAGDVTSGSASAITVRQEIATANASVTNVTAGNVSGTSGIVVTNPGTTGSIGITANGTVTGTAGSGIIVTGGGAVSVSVADIVTGTTRGLTLVGGDRGTGDISVTGAGGFVGGTGDAANILNNGNGTITIDIAGATSSAGGNGIFVRDTALGGDISVTTGALTALAVGADGVNFDSESVTGDISVVVNGDIAAGDAGIIVGARAFNIGTGNIDITANGSVDAAFGIVGDNFGRGSTTVTAIGMVNATDREGIFARTRGGDITVTAGDVTSISDNAISARVFGASGTIDVTAGNVSGAGGILALNTGAGSIGITANGAVTGTTGAGIDVTGNGAVSVNVADVVTGATRGLTLVGGTGGTGDISVSGAGGFVGGTGDAANILNNGNGSVSVNVSSASSSTEGNGIFIRDTALGGDINVTTGTVTALGADKNAIDVFAESLTGNVTVVANGDLRAANTAVSVTQSAAGAGDVDVTTGNVSGTSGIRAINNGTGAIRVAATGTVNAASDPGITAQAFGGDVTVKAGDVTSTGIAAIFAAQSEAAGAGDVDVTAANVSGDGGILANNVGTGSTSVTTIGSVNATSRRGIFAASSGGAVTVDAGDVTSTGSTAIVALQVAATGFGIIDVTASNVSGTSAITAENFGTGAVRIAANGRVTGTTREGILATGNGAVSVSVADVVAGATNGLTLVGGTGGAGDISVAGAGGFVGGTGDAANILNNGAGTITVDLSGAISSTGGSGMVVRNTVLGGDIGVAAAAVTGTTFGIDVDNRGTGDTTVTSTGDAIATAGTGLRLIAAASTGDLTVNAVNTSGTVGGIDVRALGTGDTVVNSTGTATGGTSAGVNVFNGVTSSDITVNANNASGTVGVQVLGEGIGATVVNVTGNTTGTINDGIFARNSQAASTDLTVVNAGTATGARFAIFAGNNGTGVTSITSTGDAIGGNDVDAAGFFDDAGIFAISGTTANGIIINATNVTGFRGIDAENRGIGTISVVATGNVTGLAEGIFAEAQATAGDISISAQNVTGGTVGIGIDNAGTGKAVVNIAGVVQGGTAAISSIGTDAQALTVNNNGTLRNVSGLSSDSAIIVNGGPLLLNNNGNLLGTLTLFGAVADEDDDEQPNVAARGGIRTLDFSTLAVGEDDVVNNLVTWNSIGGTSDFGVGEDHLNNRTTGRIIAAAAAGVAETTTYVNLENFSHAGVIALNDGGTGDQLVTDGSVVMESGSTLAIDIGAGNTTDMLTVGGSAAIQAGANVAINPLTPGVFGDVHTFLTAADGVTGTFTLVNGRVTLFKGYRLGYTANSAFVEFAQLRALAAAGVTPNQIAASSGVDSLAFSNPIKAAALDFTSDTQAQAAFDALSGEIHPTVRTVMTEDSRLPRNAVLERLGADRTGTVWGQAFGNWGESDGNRNAASAGRDSYGFLAGADFGGGEEGGLIAGGMIGYIDTDVVVRDRASKASVKTLHGLFYAGIRAGGFSFKAGAGYARADVDTKRSVVFTGFADSLTDGYKGSVLQGFVEAGYRLPLGEGYAEPYVALTAIRAHSNAVAESGGAAAIKAASTNEKSLMTVGGIRFGTGLSGALSVMGNVGWQHGFGRLDPFNIHALTGSAPFRIEGASQSRDAGILGIAVRYSLTSSAEFELGYDGVLGTVAQDHAAKATLRIRF